MDDKNNTYTVRPTLKDDWHTLKSLRLDALQDSPDAFTASYAETQKHSDDEWKSRAAQQSKCQYLLAFDDHSAIGMVGVIVDESNECHVVAMWVKAEYRAKGVAALLIESIKTCAQEKGHLMLHLRVTPDNFRALRFYQKQGFSMHSAVLAENIDQSSLKMCCDLTELKMTEL